MARTQLIKIKKGFTKVYEVFALYKRGLNFINAHHMTPNVNLFIGTYQASESDHYDALSQREEEAKRFGDAEHGVRRGIIAYMARMKDWVSLDTFALRAC